LGAHLDLGAVNAPNLSVATGPQAALDDLEARLKAKEIDCQRIAINIAAHSRMLEPILQEFGDYLRAITLNAPQIPFTSNRSGTYITDAEAQDPEYWVSHLRGTVRFADCLTTLSEVEDRIFIEVGPGKALSSLAGQHDKLSANQVISSLRHPKDDVADDAYFMAMLGRIWAVGGTFDWDQIWGEARRVRVPLPTYAFQHAPYFIEPGKAVSDEETQWLTRSETPEDWGYRPAWLPRYAACDVDVTGDLSEVIAPERGRESYDALISDLNTRDLLPTRILHGWMITRDESFRPGSSFFHRVQEQGFYSLFFLAQAIGGEDLPGDIHIVTLTSGAAQHKDEALPHPEKATIAGPARVIPREFPRLSVSVLDLELSEPAGRMRRGAEKEEQAALVGHILDRRVWRHWPDAGRGADHTRWCQSGASGPQRAART